MYYVIHLYLLRYVNKYNALCILKNENINFWVSTYKNQIVGSVTNLNIAARTYKHKLSLLLSVPIQ